MKIIRYAATLLLFCVAHTARAHFSGVPLVNIPEPVVACGRGCASCTTRAAHNLYRFAVAAWALARRVRVTLEPAAPKRIHS